MSQPKLSYAALAAKPAPIPEPQPIVDDHLPPSAPQLSIEIVAPAPGRKVEVPDIVRMSVTERKDLMCGYMATVFVKQPDGTAKEFFFRLLPKNRPLVRTSQISVNFLCKVSPAIKAQIQAQVGKGNEGHISNIILVDGAEEAYDVLFEHFNEILDNGILVPIPQLFDTPLYKYYHVIDICKKLEISFITDNLTYRFNNMINYQPGKWNVDPNDIRKTYTTLPAGHELRGWIADGVAKAWLGGDLRKKGPFITKITYEKEEFWNDLQARGVKG